MFTGIIQSIGKLKQEKNILEIEILDNFFDMAIGDSIAVDGICLTVKEIFQNKFTVDVSEETLKKTTLGLSRTRIRLLIWSLLLGYLIV